MSKRILVVDDSSFMRKRIREELMAHGHSIVGEAADGDEAVKMYRDLVPDLILMDISMRGTDGITASKEIRSQFPQAKVFFFTILDNEKYRSEATKTGAVGFMNKTEWPKLGQAIGDLAL